MIKTKIDKLENELSVLDKIVVKRKQELEHIENTILSDMTKIPLANKCPVCFINNGTHIIYPCGHKCLCEECGKKMNILRIALYVIVL